MEPGRLLPCPGKKEKGLGACKGWGAKHEDRGHASCTMFPVNYLSLRLWRVLPGLTHLGSGTHGAGRITGMDACSFGGMFWCGVVWWCGAVAV